MVNIYELKLTNLQQKILRLLFIKAGSSLNALTIAKRLNVSQPAVSKALPELLNEDLIKLDKNKETGRLSIELNRENYKIGQLKKIDNLKLIYESGFADFIEKEFAGATVILFGSYSRGDDNINSDIDIAVIGRKDKKINIEKFEVILERKININFYDSFKEIHKNLKENIFNGIILVGGINL
ncbi:MAG TPA: nucleotidyltransferase domain-containing protein [Candidatus Paceibacterota bacterium]|nr:nucleotidyltransferase domain-containing protein [Candidatus Paceibacterota bacterium]